jgi:hypothetical protein
MAVLTFRYELTARFLDGREQRAGFVLLAAFLVSFLFIRTSARLMRSPRVTWWPGSVTTSSGLHLHHLVWGVVLLMLSGFLSFVTRSVSPWTEILAAVFGVGAGLTLDEFALWIHLRDVYWAEEGRASLDAVVVAALIGGLIVLGVAPFDIHNDRSSVATLALSVGLVVLLASITIIKGKRFLGLVGVFVPPLSLVGATRLAAPDSAWARRFYAPGGRKLSRSQARFERLRARRRRLADAVAGAPGLPPAEGVTTEAPVEAPAEPPAELTVDARLEGGLHGRSEDDA